MVARTIARTRLDNVKPLGEPSQRTYEFVVGNVRRALGDRHAALFAEPSNQAGLAVWQSELPGEILPLSSLSPDTAEELKTKLGKIVADILAVADDFAVKADPAAQSIAIALRNAVEVPSEECIFSVGGAPVIVQWGFHLDVYAPPRALLSRLIPPTRPVVEPSARDAGPAVAAAVVAPLPEDEKRSRLWDILWWLGWLLLAVLIFIVLYLAIPACGVWPFSFLDRCETSVLAADDPHEESDRIQAEIDALERAILDLDRQCVAGGAGTTAEAPVQDGAKTVEEAITEGDSSLLAGCWQLDSNYTLYVDGDINRPRKVQDWQVCLDEAGENGTQRLVFDNGTVCEGTLKSTVTQGEDMTWVDDAPMQCDDSSFIVRRKNVCRTSAETSIQCGSVDLERENSQPVDVKLRRQ